MTEKTLHPVQAELLKLLIAHADDPLTIRDLQDRVSASSTSVVAHHLSQLEKKGYLKRNPYNPRDYQVVHGGPEPGITRLNLYGMGHCGPGGSILDGNPIDRIAIASRLVNFAAAEAFMVKAKGKSMEPKIHEGDLVIARKTTIGVDGKVYVCVNDEECLIKTLRFTGNKIFLESFNREYPLIAASKDFRVEGEVRTVISGKF